jgi:photosystem II stability/assembly factor-like uncharacterized protein
MKRGPARAVAGLLYPRCLLGLAVLAVASPAGAAWRGIGPPNQDATAVVVIPPGFVAHPSFIVLVGTSDQGLFSSRDGGETWTSSSSGLGTSLSITCLAPFPNNFPDVGPAVLAGTMNGLFRSRDGGLRWEELSRGLPASPRTIHSVVWAGGLFAAVNDNVYRSTDGGDSWASVLSATVRDLKADPAAPMTIFAAGSDVYRSTDGGQSWSAVGPLHGTPGFSFSATSIGFGPGTPSTIFVGGNYGPGSSRPASAVFRSGDGGATWKSLGSSLRAPSDFAFVAPASVYAAVPGAGVLVSMDSGDSWSSVNDGLTDPQVRDLALDPFQPSTLYAATASGVFQQGEAACSSGPATLCLNAGRFRVEVAWSSSSLGQAGTGQAVPLTSDTGAFWFFQPSNLELVVKVLDGRAVNGHFWVFFGALSNVGYTITVTDTATSAVRTYTNPDGTLASGADTAAFD